MTLLPQTIGNVREVDITHEMQNAYLDYAMSVIVARALPDVRDGLKPVHRRILYAMSDMGLTNDKPYKKSARIVGEVLGKYHPHGDTAVYDAMARMAQDFSLRYPLVDGQGNFGSIDGDNPAAMRYTEARLAQISNLMLVDLDKETVDWTDNFDNTLKEPEILPATLPNLLINGASGIAVGMSTNVPPHNLGEVIDALVYLLDNYQRLDEISIEDLLKFVKGPDFPTGGIVFRYREDRRGNETTDVITQGYATGRARLIIQAKAHFEEMSRGRTRIIVTELPYQTNKTNLLERIASLVRDGKLDGITDMRDETDRTGMRIVIEINRNADPKGVLADLFKYTPMQQTFGMSMLALVDGEPRMLGLKRILQSFIEHRQVVIRRRSEFDLARARERAHIVEGLLRALDILDEVIETIRRSQRVDTARTNLMRNFDFSELQAQAILDMPLKRLAALERKKLQDEYDELQERIRYLEDLLAHPEKILAVIKEELQQIRAQYADARRTQIVDRTKGTLTATDLLPDQKVWISVGANGEVRRQAFADISKTSLRQSGRDSGVALLTANTQNFLYVFDRSGGSNRISIHELPLDEVKHLADFTTYTRRDRIVAALALPRLTPDEAAGYLFMATKAGIVKRIALAEFVAAASGNPEIIRVESNDELGWVFLTPGEQEVILVSSGGNSIRFSENDVRSMGLAAGGVAGMKLKKGEKIVFAGLVDPAGELVTVTESGYTKRTSLNEHSSQGRNGSGIIAHRLDKRTGRLIDALVVNSERRDLVVFLTEKGVAKPVEVGELPASGRNTIGQNGVTVSRGDRLVAIKVVEAIPGFVGDETLAPPAAKGNGKPSRTVAPANSKQETAVIAPAASNGHQQTGESTGRTPRSRAEKTAAQPETGATTVQRRRGRTAASEAPTKAAAKETIAEKKAVAQKAPARQKVSAKNDTVAEQDSSLKKQAVTDRKTGAQRKTPVRKKVGVEQEAVPNEQPVLEKEPRASRKRSKPAASKASVKTAAAAEPPRRRAPRQSATASPSPSEMPIQPELIPSGSEGAPAKTATKTKKSKVERVRSVTAKPQKK